MNLILFLMLLIILFGIGFTITGAIIKAIVWATIILPVALFLWGCGIAFCCTLILIPVGLRLIWTGFRVVTCS